MGREAGLQSRIAKHLRACGWFAQVEHGNAYTGRGRSDLIVCAHGHFIAIEVKTMDDDSKTTPLQDKYLADVRAAGGAAFVARSVDEAEYFIREALYARNTSNVHSPSSTSGEHARCSSHHEGRTSHDSGVVPDPRRSIGNSVGRPPAGTALLPEERGATMSELDDLIAQLEAAAPSVSSPTAVLVNDVTKEVLLTAGDVTIIEDDNELTDFFSPSPAAAPAADDDLSRALLEQAEQTSIYEPEVEILMQPVLNQTSVIPFETVEAAFESVPPERLAEATKPKAGVPASGDRLDRLCDLLEQLVGAVQALIDQTVTAEPTRKPRAKKTDVS